VISPAGRAVSVDGQPVPVGARAFDLLLALAQRRDRLVGRDELLDLVWPGVVVEEHNITAQISALRKLLGPQVIATVPGRGYRFVAAADEASAAAPASGEEERRHNLPDARTRFIGRDAVLADIERLLAQSRLLTLTGIGGSGKTRVALECGRRLLADGAFDVWFVDLAPLTAPERVAFACANVFGVADGAEESLLERLTTHLAGRPVLLVLDNCEHVRTGAAALVDALLARAPGTRVLATSREPLAVAGEQLYPLRPLSLPATDDVDDVRAADAVRLFVDRARLAWPEFEVDAANAAAVADICRRLDGIALAVELAAAQLPLLSVFDIAGRLKDRFRLLMRGTSAAARQQTLVATMQWSYDQLEPAEQRMFRLLSVFAGGCTLDAAMALAGIADEYEALGLLSGLYGKSLLVIEFHADADGRSRPRYGMLETVRQYARERLGDRGEAEAALTRHAGIFLQLAEQAAPHLDGPQQSWWMKRLRAEHENFAAAMHHCADHVSADPTWALRLAAASGKYWLFNEVDLGCRLARAALARAGADVDTPARFHTLRALAGMHMHRGQGEAGLLHAREALALALRAGNLEWQAIAHNAIGTCLMRADAEEDSLLHYQQARALALASGHTATLSSVANNIANIDFRAGRLDDAERGYSQALHLARAQGNVRAVLIFLHNLIRVTVAARKHAEAHDFAAESEELLRDVGEDVLKLELLEVTAGLASILGEHPVAARWWGYAYQRYLDQGYVRPTVDEAQLQRLLAASREAMGAAAFDKAAAVGRALDLAAAMRELRSWLERRG
jgi:predicted ATPase/DNA-binding winged helix-turn-helix (wHTH) protein